jgi:1-acyl-sn-glycerol-3-phosphate acyltransferase
MTDPLFNILHAIVSAAMHLMFGIKILGRENIPVDEGFVTVANHRSNADPPLVNVAVKRKLCFIAKKELFKFRPFAWLITKCGAIPSTSDDPEYDIISEAIRHMEEEKRCICIFPEGHRHKDGKTGKGKLGAALMASKTEAAVLPVGISYRGNLHFRTKMEIRIGRPLYPADFGCGAESELKDMKGFRDKMMEEIAFLADPDKSYKDYLER